MELIAVPNVSEGRDAEAIVAIGRAFASTGAEVLDVHSDADHHRSVYTLRAPAGELAYALRAGAREVTARVDLRTERGSHPHVGALDVAPVVWLEPEQRGAACAEALLTADLLAEDGLPVYLYGLLGGGRSRAELRKGGLAGLRERGARPDFGPEPAEVQGATLVAARPPLIAFNFELAPPATLDDARRIAALVREGGAEGLAGVRALGLELQGGEVAQVSTNVEDHLATPLAAVLAAIERHAEVREAELIGVPPAAAFAGWPERIPVRNRRTLEEVGR